MRYFWAMSDSETRILEAHADLARTLGNVHRLALLQHASREEMPVERLAELSGLSVANASQHLQQLRRAGLVRARRNGKQVLYGLGSGPILELLAALKRHVDHTHSEIRNFVADSIDRNSLVDAISRDELVARMKDGSVTVLDVRPTQEFALGHLPGALNIPVEELERRLAGLSHDKEIVAYCRGPYCALSTDAVAVLRARGMRARRLAAGYPDWKAAGLEVEAA